MQTPNTLNITVGTDVILNVTLEHDGETITPSLIDDLQANLITGLGRKTPLETSTCLDYIVVNIPWVDGRLPGCYSLEITGSINNLAWSSVGKSIIRYTSATEIGRSTVAVKGDTYDVTMEVGYYFTDSPIEDVNVTVDDGVGTPSAVPSYVHRELSIDFHNLKGNGIADIEQTTTSTESHGVNVVTITEDNGQSTNVEIRNGGIGPIGHEGIPGKSAIFNPETGDISVMEQSTGDSIVSPMSQAAVTKELCCSFDEIDLASYTTIAKTFIATDTLKWVVQSSNSNNCKMIPIQDGWKALKIVSYYAGDVERAYHVEFLSSTEPGANNTPAAIVGEPRGERTMAEDESIIVIPEGATCIYVRNWKANDIDRVLPQSISVSTGLNGLKEKLEGEIDSVSDEKVSEHDSSETSHQDIRQSITESSENLKKEILDGVTSNYKKGYYVNRNGIVTQTASHPEYGVLEKIPCVAGDTIVAYFGKSSLTGAYLCAYDSNGNFINAWAQAGHGTPWTITIPETEAYADCAYINVPFSTVKSDGTRNAMPVKVNDTEYHIIDKVPSLNAIDETVGGFDTRITALEDIVSPTDTEHGTIGLYYPDQVAEINNYIGLVATGAFSFIHVSDNHNYNKYGMVRACAFLDYCNAQFLVNTGDLVANAFTDGGIRTIEAALTPQKPVYLVLGNHDYYKAPSRQDIIDYFFGDAETEGSVNYHNAQYGGVATDKTYYSVDLVNSVDNRFKLKCIMLDMNDGWDETQQGWSGDLDIFAVGKMSHAQINWFMSELKSARTNGQHVCVFIHFICDEYDKERIITEFTDRRQEDHCDLSFLPDIVDAFINGGTVEFTYDGNTYSETFTAGGAFVSWFSGHTHFDCAGWLQDHPNQFSITILRPDTNGSTGSGVPDDGKANIHVNFVTVNTWQRSMTVYRIGQQNTIFGKRKSFRIFYK